MSKCPHTMKIKDITGIVRCGDCGKVISGTKRMNRLTLIAPIVLAACGTLTPTEQSAVTAATTVASIAAASNTTVAQIVAGGQLFCSGSTLFAVAGTSVIGKTSQAVAAICKAVDAIAVPVSPPATAGSVPVVSVPAS